MSIIIGIEEYMQLKVAIDGLPEDEDALDEEIQEGIARSSPRRQREIWYNGVRYTNTADLLAAMRKRNDC